MTSQRDQGHGRSGHPRRHEAETATSSSPTLVEALRGLSVPDAGHQGPGRVRCLPHNWRFDIFIVKVR